MKRLLSLIFVFGMVGCTTLSRNCKHSIHSFLSSKPLSAWKDMTEKAMIESKDPKLQFLEKNAKSDSVDLFDRNLFLENLNAVYRADSLSYTDLYIIEFSSSGEVNIMEKVLFAKCNEIYKVIKFNRNGSHWINVKTLEKDSKIIDHMFSDFKNSPNGGIYWGSRIGDILAITEIKDNSVFKVDMYSALNKERYELITKLIN